MTCYRNREAYTTLLWKKNLRNLKGILSCILFNTKNVLKTMTIIIRAYTKNKKMVSNKLTFSALICNMAPWDSAYNYTSFPITSFLF